jgi:hypothetical protein
VKERRETAIARRSARIAIGLCPRCACPARPDGQLCARCYEVIRGCDRRRYAALMAAGKCVRCGDIPRIGAQQCEGCLAYARGFKERRKS